jgi:ABC-2 type transport system permease protein
LNKRNFLIKESLKKKLKSKWFLGTNIFVFLMILLTLNINTIISLFGGKFEEEYTVYVKDELNIYEDFKKGFNDNNIYFKDNYKVELKRSSLEELQQEATNNDKIIVLYLTRDDDNYLRGELYSKKEVTPLAVSAMLSSLNKIKREMAIENSYISKEEINKINAGVQLDRKILKKESEPIKHEDEQKIQSQKTVIGGIVIVAFLLPFFFLIVTLVQMIGAEINEEKTNKSMEIIISNVKPEDHLISKIVSCTVFTLIQISLLVLYFFIANWVKSLGPSVNTGTGSVLMEAVKDIITPDVIAPIIRIIPLLVIFFLFTLITYAVIAGVLASITTSIDDFQQLQTPLMLIISLGFYISIMAVIFEGSRFIKFMSFIPLISFLLAPSLYMLNQISIVSLIIAIILQIIFSFIVYKYGLRIYKEGILNYSGTNLWKKMFRSMKAK